MINIQNQNNGDELSQIDRNFVNSIVNKISLFGQIPYSIPIPMIIEVIKSSARYFYKYHANAWKLSYYKIDLPDIIKYAGSDNFSYIGITISPRIRVIKEIYESTGTTSFGITGAMYDTAKSNHGDMYGSSINNNLYIIESAVKLVESRGFDNIFSARIPYDFSPNTHELLLKRKPKANLVLECYVDNEISSLYNDSLFERHVMANTKRELKRLIAGHTFNLPGGVTLSAEEICNNIEDSENVETILKASNGIGDIIMKRR